MVEEVIAKLQERMATLRLGDPLDKNTDIGAINSAEQLARIRELSDAGEAEGAERWSPPCELPENGWFPPTIFTGVSASHRTHVRDFRPGASVLTFPTLQEAVDKANNTPCGLSAGIWTERGARASSGWRGSCGPESSGPIRSTASIHGLAVRRLQGIGLRARGRPARAGGLPCPLSSRACACARRTSSRSAAPSRARSRAVPTRSRMPPADCSRRRLRPRARTFATRSSRRARRSRAGRVPRRTTAGR